MGPAELYARADAETQAPGSKTGRLASLPSVAQLKNLIDEESAAETCARQTKPVPKEEEAYGRFSPAVDLPTLEQLTRLKTEREAEADIELYRPAAASRRSASAYGRKKEPAPRPVYAAAREKKAPLPVKKTAKPKPAEPGYAPVERAPARRSVPAVELPTLDQLQAILAGAEEAPAAPRGAARYDRAPSAPAKSVKVRPAVPRAVEVDRAPERVRTVSPKTDTRPFTARFDEDDYEIPQPQTVGKKEIPTVEQLRSLLAMEQEYGDFSFQERVREIRQGREKPEFPEEKPAPRRAAENASGRVHYIPYESFDENEAAPGAQESEEPAKKAEAAPAQGVPEPEQVEAAELKANDEKKEKKPFFAERKPRKEKRKTGTAGLPYWLNSLLRSS